MLVGMFNKIRHMRKQLIDVQSVHSGRVEAIGWMKKGENEWVEEENLTFQKQ